MSDPEDDPLMAPAGTAPIPAVVLPDTSGITTHPKPTVLTSQFECSDAVKHIVSEILALPDPDRILYILAENGFLDTDDILMLNDDMVDNLVKVPYQGKEVKTNVLERIKLKTIVPFHEHAAVRLSIFNLTPVEWFAITYETWFTWKNDAMRAKKATKDASVQTETSNESRSKADYWIYGVKKNPNEYSSFEDYWFWLLQLRDR
jgi:hypothetical protein